MRSKNIVIFNVGVKGVLHDAISVVETIKNSVLREQYFSFFGGEDMVYTIFIGDRRMELGDVRITTKLVSVDDAD